MTSNETWAWCSSCQSLYRHGDTQSAWSCAAGGVHGDPRDRSTAGGRFRVRVLEAPPPAAKDQTSSIHPTLSYLLHSEFHELVVSGEVNERADQRAVEFMNGSITAEPVWHAKSGQLTVSWWMKPDAQQVQDATILDHRSRSDSGATINGFAIFINSGRLSVELANGHTAFTFVFGTTKIPADDITWRMYTLTFGTQLRLYIDDELQGEQFSDDWYLLPTVIDRAVPGLALRVGQSLLADRPFRGLVADVAIYDRELNGAQVAARMLETHSRSARDAAVHGWVHCVRCDLLLFREVGTAPPRGCHARGGRPHVLGGRARDITAQSDDPQAVGSTGWTRCRKCSGLFFGPFSTSSSCGAGGRHDTDHSQFRLNVVESPDFANVHRGRDAINALYLAANRQSDTMLSIEDEKAYLVESLAEGTGIHLRANLRASLDELAQEIRQTGPQIVQFSAHGFESDTGGTGLWLSSTNGNPVEVTIAELRELFATIADERSDTQPLLGQDALFDAHGHNTGVKLVILNICNSRAAGEQLGQVVDYVIAVDGVIPDDAARFFTPLFFSELAQGARVESALATARRALVTQGFFAPNQIPTLVSAPTRSS